MLNTILPQSNSHVITELKKLNDYDSLRFRNSNEAWVKITILKDCVSVDHVNGMQCNLVYYSDYNRIDKFCWQVLKLVWGIK